jgi:hypothetical protein
MSASLSVFEKEHAAREKYIYFVCGLAGALVAYIVKDYFPVRPIDFIGELTMSAMISLTLCLAFGMVHIQFFIKGTSINKDVLVADEELKNFVNTLVARKAGQCNLSVNTKTGKEYTTEEIEASIVNLKASRDIDFNRMTKWFWWSTVWFIVCHIFLVFGFFFLIYSKFTA